MGTQGARIKVRAVMGRLHGHDKGIHGRGETSFVTASRSLVQNFPVGFFFFFFSSLPLPLFHTMYVKSLQRHTYPSCGYTLRCHISPTPKRLWKFLPKRQGLYRNSRGRGPIGTYTILVYTNPFTTTTSSSQAGNSRPGFPFHVFLFCLIRDVCICMYLLMDGGGGSTVDRLGSIFFFYFSPHFLSPPKLGSCLSWPQIILSLLELIRLARPDDHALPGTPTVVKTRLYQVHL